MSRHIIVGFRMALGVLRQFLNAGRRVRRRPRNCWKFAWGASRNVAADSGLLQVSRNRLRARVH